MTEFDGEHRARLVRLADLPSATIGDHIWYPLRRTLEITGFGVGVYSAATAGEVLVGTHDETSSSSNRHEELYIVLAGRALFEVDGLALEIGPEEFLVVDPGARRGAKALVDGTSVLVIGGTRGTVLPAPYEHWYAALTTDDPAESALIAAAGLVDHPEHGQLNYQLACFRALAGELEAAGRHLRRAVTADERAWDWLVDDTDLDSLRSVPGCVPTRTTVGPLYIEQAGHGPAVVLLHAGIADRRMWDPQWVEWPADLSVTRLDLREFGRSERADGSFSHAGDVLAMLDALSIARAVLVGASLGGLVALDLAASHPERVVGLVLADPALPGRSWSAVLQAHFAAEEAAFATGDLGHATELNVDFWLPAASEPVRAAIRDQQRAAFELQAEGGGDESLLTRELLPRLSSLDTPTLVLVGESDHADFHTIADLLATELPSARRETVRQAGHLPSLEQPAAFDAIVRPFVGSIT